VRWYRQYHNARVKEGADAGYPTEISREELAEPVETKNFPPPKKDTARKEAQKHAIRRKKSSVQALLRNERKL